MKRFFNSPQPLAFFGFLLTFLLTVAWRMPLQAPHLFGTAEAAPPPTAPAAAPTVEPVAVPQPIPQVLAVALPVPPAQTAVLAPSPTMLPATAGFVPPAPALAAPSAESTESPRETATTKKKSRRGHKPKVASPASDEGVGGLLSAATEGRPTTKKRVHRD